MAAIGAGLLADKFSASRITVFGFLFMLVGGSIVAFGPIGIHATVLVMTAIVTTGIGVFALRGLYFAIMHEGRTPLAITGTVVGIASLIGYLPDTYKGPVMGVLLDGHPGSAGHRYVFMTAAGFAIMGLITTFIFRRIVVSTEQ